MHICLYGVCYSQVERNCSAHLVTDGEEGFAVPHDIADPKDKVWIFYLIPLSFPLRIRLQQLCTSTFFLVFDQALLFSFCRLYFANFHHHLIPFLSFVVPTLSNSS